jgi:hypothetical protein
VPALCINLPSTSVQPVAVALFKPPLSLSVSFWAMVAINTSPANTPDGLLIEIDEMLVPEFTLVVADPRC